MKAEKNAQTREDTWLWERNDRESYQVVIEDSSTLSIQLFFAIQLFFDVESGVLLRKVNATNTMLGPLNVQWDFSDYRDVSGIKLPFLSRTSDVSSYERWSSEEDARVRSRLYFANSLGCGLSANSEET